jgi:hypothetical protein
MAKTLARKGNTVMSRAGKAKGTFYRLVLYIQEASPRQSGPEHGDEAVPVIMPVP